MNAHLKQLGRGFFNIGLLVAAIGIAMGVIVGLVLMLQHHIYLLACIVGPPAIIAWAYVMGDEQVNVGSEPNVPYVPWEDDE